MPDFGKWADRMISGDHMPKAHRIRLNADGGYMGIQNHFLGITVKLPHKKPKVGELSATKKVQNKARSQKRISVEHVFAHVKNWKLISGIYEGTAEEFNMEFNGICGLYNKRKMWQDDTYNRWKNKIMN